VTEKASLPDTVLFYSYSNLPVCEKKNDSWLFMNSQSSQFSAPVEEGVSKTQEISERTEGWRVNKVTRCPLIHYTLNKFNFFLQK